MVVGAAGGLGTAICHALAPHCRGMYLVDNGSAPTGEGEDAERVSDLARALIRALKKPDRRAERLILSDASDIRHDPQATVARAWDALGDLDILVYCAGNRAPGSLARGDLASRLDAAMDASFTAMALSGSFFARKAIAERRKGSILVMAGNSAFSGARHAAFEGAAQAATLSFVRSAALEWRKHGVRINGLIPTAKTRWTAGASVIDAAQTDAFEPAHVAAVARYLVDPATEISGEWVGVAGGRVYAVGAHETPGIFSEDNQPWQFDALAERFDEVFRRQ